MATKSPKLVTLPNGRKVAPLTPEEVARMFPGAPVPAPSKARAAKPKVEGFNLARITVAALAVTMSNSCNHKNYRDVEAVLACGSCACKRAVETTATGLDLVMEIHNAVVIAIANAGMPEDWNKEARAAALESSEYIRKHI